MGSSLKPSDVHVSVPLTNLAIRYKNLALVGERILPVVPVVKEADKYYVFSKEELKVENTLRAAGAEAMEISWDVSTSTYSCEEYSLRHLVPDRIMNNADAAVRPKITATYKLTQKILLEREKAIAEMVQDTNNVNSSATPSVKWNGTSPDIESNVDTAKNAVRSAAGTEPTSIVLPYLVQQAVKRDSTVRNLIRYTVPNDILLRNGDLPPVLWNLEVITAGAIRNTANEGVTESLSDVWTDSVLVFYKEASPSLDALSLGYTFRAGNFVVTSYREDKRKGDD